MKLYNIEVFCLVVESGSISSAAKKLMISPSAVSQHLREIEKHYNTVLTYRSGRNIFITKDGEEVYDFARQTLDREQLLRERLVQLKESSSQRYELGLSLLLVQLYRQSLTKSSVSPYSLAVKTMPSVDICQQVIEGKLDLGLAMTRVVTHVVPKAHLLNHEVLFHIPLLVVGQIGHHLANQNGVSKSEVEKEPFVVAAHNRRFGQPGHTGLNYKNIVLEINDMESFKHAVMNGKGLAIVSYPDVEQELASGKLSVIKMTDFEIDCRFSLVYPLAHDLPIDPIKDYFCKVIPPQYGYRPVS